MTEPAFYGPGDVTGAYDDNIGDPGSYPYTGSGS